MVGLTSDLTVRGLLSVFLLAGMLFYSINSIRKFREHKVAVSVQRDTTEPRISFPSVTLCSGFRDGDATPEKVAREAAARGEEDPAALDAARVRGMTYDREEFVKAVVVTRDDVAGGNLRDNASLWEEEVHEYYGGRCQTFNPAGDTEPGEVNSLSVALWDPYRANYDGDGEGSYKKLGVFLHPRGGFLYSKALKFFGVSLVYPTQWKKKKRAIYKRRFVGLDLEEERCDGDADVVSWKRCVRAAYDRLAGGCKMPWRTDNMEELRHF